MFKIGLKGIWIIDVKRLKNLKNLSISGMEFGRNFSGNSFVYVGGLPSFYSTKLSSLALPSAVFEPRFRGSIRNVVFADDETGRPRRQEVMAYKVSTLQKQGSIMIRDLNCQKFFKFINGKNVFETAKNVAWKIGNHGLLGKLHFKNRDNNDVPLFGVRGPQKP